MLLNGFCYHEDVAMQRKMHEISVRTTTEGMIELEQSIGEEENPNIIEISPDQAEIVIRWLKEAYEELSSEKGASSST